MPGQTFKTIPGLASEAGKKSRRGPSKVSGQTKEKIARLVDKLFDDVMGDMDSLETKDKANLLVKLIEYEIPKRRAVESTVELSMLSDEEVNELIERIMNHEQET